MGTTPPVGPPVPTSQHPASSLEYLHRILLPVETAQDAQEKAQAAALAEDASLHGAPPQTAQDAVAEQHGLSGVLAAAFANQNNAHHRGYSTVGENATAAVANVQQQLFQAQQQKLANANEQVMAGLAHAHQQAKEVAGAGGFRPGAVLNSLNTYAPNSFDLALAHGVNLHAAAAAAATATTSLQQATTQTHSAHAHHPEGSVHGAHHVYGPNAGNVAYAAGDSTRGGSYFTMLSNQTGETLDTSRGGDDDIGPEDSAAADIARLPINKEDRAKQLQALQSLFVYRLKEAAARLGVGTTSLKRICRAHGIKRWPHRKVFSVAKSVEQLRTATGCATQANAAVLTMAAVCRHKEKQEMVPKVRALPTQVNAAVAMGPNAVDMSMRGETLYQNLVAEGHAMNANQPQAADDGNASGPEPQQDSNPRRRDATPPSEADEGTTEQNQPTDGDNGNKLATTEYANPIYDSNGAIRDGKSMMLAKAGVHDDTMSIVKVEYGDDVVKLRIKQDDALSCRALLSAAKQRFQLPSDVRMRLKYQDADGEWLLLSDDADLVEAWARRDKGTRNGSLRLRMSDQKAN
ncbi:protein NLP5 [Pseudoscourfieldia marina]